MNLFSTRYGMNYKKDYNILSDQSDVKLAARRYVVDCLKFQLLNPSNIYRDGQSY